MNRWLLTLGDFASSLGRVVELRLESSGRWTAGCIATYEPSPSRRVQGKGLTGARLVGERLWVCHFNGIVRYDIRRDVWDTWLERDDFNDLHDIDLELDSLGRVERVAVANTGRDEVLILDSDGTIVAAHELHPCLSTPEASSHDPYFNDDILAEPWRQKLRDRVHPNAVRFTRTGLLVSRFLDRRIEELPVHEPQFGVLDGLPHDLMFVDDEVWCTTTDGRVWALVPGAEAQPRLVLDTYVYSGVSGWCRGLAVCDRWILVGLTRITAMPRDRWCDRPAEDTQTAVLVFDRTTLDHVALVTLNTFGVRPKLFSILPALEDTHD